MNKKIENLIQRHGICIRFGSQWRKEK